MRVSTQLAVVALAGGVGLLTWSQWPLVSAMFSAAPPSAGANAPAQAGAPAAGQRRGPAPGAASVLVEVATVGTGSIIESSENIGTTRALESVAVTSKVSGIVDRISFAEGQIVKAGDELVRLDVTERVADLEATRASINTTKAQRQETMQKLDRALSLRQSGSGTEAQVADLTLQLRTAETNIAAAEARERAAAARLDDLVVRAPFGGRVGLRMISLGALLDSKVVITTLDDVSKIRLDFSVPEPLMARIAVDAIVDSHTLAFPGRRFQGKVAVIDTRIDPITRSAKLMALIDNSDGMLKPGMFMNVSLQVALRENAILAPEEAIVAEGPRQIAFIVKDGKIDRRVVTIGQRQGGAVEILSGIAVGETLVVRGVQRIKHGAPVTTKPASPVTAGDRLPGMPAGKKA